MATSTKKKSLGEKIVDGVHHILDKDPLADEFPGPDDKPVPGDDEVKNQPSVSDQGSLSKFSKFRKG